MCFKISKYKYSRLHERSMQFRRKLYTRGSSYETTIPRPLLFDRDLTRKHDILFEYDAERKAWYLRIEERRATGRREKA